MNRCVIVVVIFYIINSIDSAPSLRDEHESTGLTTYDQKQTGKYNIHLNIKDVAIIALDTDHLDSGIGDFGDDYYDDYDLSDFTVKPIYGVIGFDTTTSKPLLPATPTPSIFHSEQTDLIDALPLSSSNTSETENAEPVKINESSSSAEDVIVISSTTKVPVESSPIASNKTQNVVILNQSSSPSSSTPSSINSVSILSYNDTSNSTGIVVTTPTPSPEDLPPKIILSATPVKPEKSPEKGQKVHESVHPGEIPVQIIMEPILQSTRQYHKNRPQNNYRIRNRVRATPSHSRITPPNFENDHIAANSNPQHLKLRRNTQNNNPHNRRCATYRNGKCQSNRRSSSSM